MFETLLQQLDASAIKPALTALLLPPVPLLLLVLLGAALQRGRPRAGWTCILAGVCGLWLTATTAVGDALASAWVAPLRALESRELQQLKRDGSAGTVIVVLGGGREAYSPEYAGGSLRWPTLERLRYGLWLARETGLPVGFSGGIGHAQADGPSEAEVAARIATRDFGRALRFTESSSRDTRENAHYTVAMVRSLNVQRIILITHGWHMRRSLRAFREAAAAQGMQLTLLPAPIGAAPDDSRALLRWLPSAEGFMRTRQVLREMLGWLAGS
jgi:uncharacterized SAM-binding protein YcdF (DUF218 family)